jgi:hypothetical protein
VQTLIVFTIYVIFFNWLITRIAFIKNSGLSSTSLIILFSLKIIAGLIYAWFYLQPAYYYTSDTWHYFELSKTETNWLLNDPVGFFKDIFTYGYQSSGNLFSGTNSYWNDLKSTVIVKLLAICNVLTFKNYFADLVWFNLIFFAGCVMFYAFLQRLFTLKKILLISCVFLIPSFLFWCSGIHKDGLIFFSLALIVSHFYRLLKNKKINLSSLLTLLFAFLLLFALRSSMVVISLPALLVWFLIYYYPGKTKRIIIVTYSLGILLFFLSAKIAPAINLPQYVIEKQKEFKSLSGGSQILVPLLENNALSFLEFLPTAIDIAFFRPHITEVKNFAYFPSALEIFALWSFMIIALLKALRKKITDAQRAFIFFCFCFSISFLLLAGYTITFSGAIVRYRAVVLPFFCLPITVFFSSNSKSSLERKH